MPLRFQTRQNAILLAKRLFRLERSGRYQEALDDLAELWPDVSFRPELDQFDVDEAAEILLRCGSLIGFHGHNVQMEGAQDRSRDLLMEAQASFITRNEIRKAAECENYLALSYWRTGELNEAQIWIEESFSRPLQPADRIRLHSQIIQCLINIPAKKDSQNLALLKSYEAAFMSCSDNCLKGDYFNHCGIALDNLGRKTEALEHFISARHYHQLSRHRIYLGTVENNIAWLYKELGQFEQAHAAIDNATRLFRSIKDSTREGFSLDTKASLFIAEKRYEEALISIEKAVSILKKSSNSAYMVETLMTRAKVLLFLNNFPDAVVSLIDAVNIARVQTGETAVKRLIDDFEETLRTRHALETEVPADSQIAEGSFDLVLPASIGHYSDYRGIWINNTRLEGIGLHRGSLAIVAKAVVERGDLAAISELETGDVSCGFYDCEFGIVCLEGTGGEPQVFNESEIRVLGKIVGVCHDPTPNGGKVAVESLNL